MDGKNTAVIGSHSSSDTGAPAVRRASLWAASLATVMACGSVVAVNADSPANTKTDVELTQRIRRSLTEDKTVSAYGKNVKISSLNGKVTLSGVVRTQIDKQQIGAKAASVAGPDNVVNALEIAPAR